MFDSFPSSSVSQPVKTLGSIAENTRVENRERSIGDGDVRVVNERLPLWPGKIGRVFDLIKPAGKSRPGGGNRPQGRIVVDRRRCARAKRGGRAVPCRRIQRVTIVSVWDSITVRVQRGAEPQSAVHDGGFPVRQE